MILDKILALVGAGCSGSLIYGLATGESFPAPGALVAAVAACGVAASLGLLLRATLLETR